MTALAVLGATGRTGRLVVEQALDRGHRVTAIVRGPGALGLDHPLLTIVVADIAAPGALRGLLDGHDAVLSALGATDRRPTTLYSGGTAAIIDAMPSGGRLLVVSSAGVEIPSDAGRIASALGAVLHRIMRETYTDMARMERLLAASDLAWTAVRPTRLTDRPATGRPRIAIGARTRVGSATARADLAAYLLDAVGDPRTERTAVAVSS
ncbi:NAD(P)-dependent oxidoreductase [Nocardia sp. NPDC052566]|uniref:NAD(P)-dependent oxidoreductase n=1 Tax=Nocardia sp. NPDC052566 TaxID=3364330 RepID=UPI0037CAB3A0